MSEQTSIPSRDYQNAAIRSSPQGAENGTTAERPYPGPNFGRSNQRQPFNNKPHDNRQYDNTKGGSGGFKSASSAYPNEYKPRNGSVRSEHDAHTPRQDQLQSQGSAGTQDLHRGYGNHNSSDRVRGPPRDGYEHFQRRSHQQDHNQRNYNKPRAPLNDSLRASPQAEAHSMNTMPPRAPHLINSQPLTNGWRPNPNPPPPPEAMPARSVEAPTISQPSSDSGPTPVQAGTSAEPQSFQSSPAQRLPSDKNQQPAAAPVWGSGGVTLAQKITSTPAPGQKKPLAPTPLQHSEQVKQQSAARAPSQPNFQPLGRPAQRKPSDTGKPARSLEGGMLVASQMPTPAKQQDAQAAPAVPADGAPIDTPTDSSCQAVAAAVEQASPQQPAADAAASPATEPVADTQTTPVDSCGTATSTAVDAPAQDVSRSNEAPASELQPGQAETDKEASKASQDTPAGTMQQVPAQVETPPQDGAAVAAVPAAVQSSPARKSTQQKGTAPAAKPVWGGKSFADIVKPAAAAAAAKPAGEQAASSASKSRPVAATPSGPTANGGSAQPHSVPLYRTPALARHNLQPMPARHPLTISLSRPAHAQPPAPAQQPAAVASSTAQSQAADPAAEAVASSAQPEPAQPSVAVVASNALAEPASTATPVVGSALREPAESTTTLPASNALQEPAESATTLPAGNAMPEQTESTATLMASNVAPEQAEVATTPVESTATAVASDAVSAPAKSTATPVASNAVPTPAESTATAAASHAVPASAESTGTPPASNARPEHAECPAVSITTPKVSKAMRAETTATPVPSTAVPMPAESTATPVASNTVPEQAASTPMPAESTATHAASSVRLEQAAPTTTPAESTATHVASNAVLEQAASTTTPAESTVTHAASNARLEPASSTTTPAESTATHAASNAVPEQAASTAAPVARNAVPAPAESSTTAPANSNAKREQAASTTTPAESTATHVASNAVPAPAGSSTTTPSNSYAQPPTSSTQAPSGPGASGSWASLIKAPAAQSGASQPVKVNSKASTAHKVPQWPGPTMTNLSEKSFNLLFNYKGPTSTVPLSEKSLQQLEQQHPAPAATGSRPSTAHSVASSSSGMRTASATASRSSQDAWPLPSNAAGMSSVGSPVQRPNSWPATANGSQERPGSASGAAGTGPAPRTSSWSTPPKAASSQVAPPSSWGPSGARARSGPASDSGNSSTSAAPQGGHGAGRGKPTHHPAAAQGQDIGRHSSGQGGRGAGGVAARASAAQQNHGSHARRKHKAKEASAAEFYGPEAVTPDNEQPQSSTTSAAAQTAAPSLPSQQHQTRAAAADAIVEGNVQTSAAAHADAEQPTPAEAQASTEQKAPAAVQAVAGQKTPAAVQGAAEQKASAAVPAVAEQKAPAAVPAAAEQKAPAAVQGAAEQKASAAVQGAAEQKAPAAVQAVAEQKAPAAVQGAAEQKATAAVQVAAEQKASAAVQAVAQQKATAAVHGTTEQKASAAVQTTIEQQPVAAPRPADQKAAISQQQLDAKVAEAIRTLCLEETPASRKALRMAPRGLQNTGNTCFMNSTLQALLSVSSFCELLDKLRVAAPYLNVAESPTLVALAQFAAEFEVAGAERASAPEDHGWSEVSSRGKKAKGNAAAAPAPAPATTAMPLNARPVTPAMLNGIMQRFSPRRLQMATANGTGKVSMVEALRLKNGSMADQDQEDAQEFFQYLVDAAHMELLHLKQSATGAPVAAGPGGYAGAAAAAGDETDEWRTVGRKNKAAVTRQHEEPTSAISEIFRGRLKSTVKANGATPSETVQPFTMLHLDISSDAISTVEEALAAYTAPEKVSGYRAKTGAAEVEATKTVQLLDLPQVLVLHLCRFSYGASGSGKVHKPVAFEAKLRLKPNMLADGCNQRSGEYKLVSTVSHHGRTSSGGHYTADALQPDGQWLHYNDHQVHVAPSAQVLGRETYLLFYQRI